MIMGFLISMLLWHLTWGWKHIILNFCIMPFLLKWIARYSFISSTLWTFVSHVCASSVYIFLMSMCIRIFGYTFNDTSALYLQIQSAPFVCAFIFATFYAALLCMFFVIMQRWYTISLKRVGIAIMISNYISAYIIAFCMK